MNRGSKFRLFKVAAVSSVLSLLSASVFIYFGFFSYSVYAVGISVMLFFTAVFLAFEDAIKYGLCDD